MDQQREPEEIRTQGPSRKSRSIRREVNDNSAKSTRASGFQGQRLLYDKPTAAEMLSISLRALNYLLSRQEIRFRRIGRRVLIPHAELVRFAHGHHPEPVAGE